MKQFGNVLSIITAIAVAILYIIYFNGKKSSSPSKAARQETSQKGIKTNIAFFNTDSINAQVPYIKKNADIMEAKQKKMDDELKAMGQRLQTRMENFQKKAAEGGYSQVSGEAEQKSIANDQAIIEKKNAQYLDQLAKENEAQASKLHKALKEVLDEINNEAGYDYIFSVQEGGFIFNPNEALNITDEVVDKLNDKLDN